MTYDPIEHTVVADGATFAAKTWGPADAPTVLCLHGWLDNVASFEPLVPFLSGLRLVAIDLAGHAQSDFRAARQAYHQVDWVTDVARVLDALGLPKVSLMGHSMGAGIAALFAGTCPERVERLVLIEGTGPRPNKPDDAPRLLQAHLRAEAKYRRIPKIKRGVSFDIAVRARLAASKLDEAAAVHLARRAAVPAEGGVRWRNDRRLHHVQPQLLSEDQVLAFLDRIECPVLHIEARDGLKYNAEVIAERQRRIRQLQHVQVEGHHHVHMDHPERVAPHLRAFLLG